jgi:hypothetical protein
MEKLSLALAAQLLLGRVATNVGDGLGTMLDALAQELARSIPIYGLDGRSGLYRIIDEFEMRCACFKHGAALLRTADGGVFTQMTVRRADFATYLEAIDGKSANLVTVAPRALIS